jgi:hypothetical protein
VLLAHVHGHSCCQEGHLSFCFPSTTGRFDEHQDSSTHSLLAAVTLRINNRRAAGCQQHRSMLEQGSKLDAVADRIYTGMYREPERELAWEAPAARPAQVRPRSPMEHMCANTAGLRAPAAAMGLGLSWPSCKKQEVTTSVLCECGSGAARRRALRGPCLCNPQGTSPRSIKPSRIRASSGKSGAKKRTP